MIFQRSMDTGGVPEDWKSANVTPIFKKGAKSEPGNYRPVSLTSICCKLLESILRDVLMEHLERNKLINQSQHGFMPKKSCGTNLLEFLEKVTREVDEGKPVDVILRWIRNWLTGRRQRVVLNGKCSDWADVLSGVPQGSVLGPILFLVFINDMDAATSVIQVMKKFADDTKLGHTVSSDVERGELQGALDNLCRWADLWGMEFNVKKCKVMHVGHNNQRFQYTMGGEQLEVRRRRGTSA
jgi:hypothetical protein